MMTRLRLHQLTKRYPKASHASVKGVNLSVAPGEFCVFVGPSGCGKSSLLRMIAGLETTSEGDLYIDELRINDVPPAKRGVAMVFQSYALYPHMTVSENMSFGLEVLGADRKAIKAKVEQAAKRLQLEPYLHRLPRELSGGQRQRVAIGRAIVKEPKLFLFDEPLSNLDAALRVQTRLEIAQLHRSIGSSSMIYVTHDQVEAMTLADRIVLLHTGDAIESEGSVAQHASPMTLYHHPASRFVAEFIGSPRMNMLPARMIEAGDHACTVAIDLGGESLQLKAHVKAESLSPGSKLTLGIRPEHCRLGSSGDNHDLAVTLEHVERLGDVTLAYLRHAHLSDLLTARLEGDCLLEPGTRWNLQCPPEHLHLFTESGRALRRTAELSSRD